MNAAPQSHEFWRQRLRVPNYGVREAAIYSDISSQTIRNWEKLTNRPSALSERSAGERLSYLQLIEVAIVAAATKAGVKLRTIRATREYLSREFESEFPFAEYRFKTDGKKMFIDYLDLIGRDGDGKLLEASGKGQLAWAQIIGRLQQFDYDKDVRLATRWHVGGSRSAVIIDPRIQFGRPSVRGVLTWIIAARSDAGEDIAYIARDFGIPKSAVADALAFEGVESEAAKAWSH